MKSRIFLALISGVFCVFGATTTVGAQTNGAKINGAQITDSTRGYDRRALRFESSYLGSAKIIRGADGPLVGTAGWFRSLDVEKLLAASPSAQAEARVFKTNNLRGSVVGAMGAAATAIGIVVTANSSNNASSPILIIGGVGAMAWSAQRFNIAYSALSRSMWWYNRDLAR
jgi:hypothetical protein